MTPDQWITRVWKEWRAKNLTRAERDVLLQLASYSRSDLMCPAHATLAGRAKCSERTVRRALVRARELGLVRWFERRIRQTWRWLRTSNRYLLTMPEGPVATTGQSGRGGETQGRKGARERRGGEVIELLREAIGQGDLLTERRARIYAEMRRKLLKTA